MSVLGVLEAEILITLFPHVYHATRLKEVKIGSLG